MTLPLPRASLGDIKPYQATRGEVVRHNLSANESCLGTSLAARDAAVAATRALERYPDGGCAVLRQAIAARHARATACPRRCASASEPKRPTVSSSPS